MSRASSGLRQPTGQKVRLGVPNNHSRYAFVMTRELRVKQK